MFTLSTILIALAVAYVHCQIPGIPAQQPYAVIKDLGDGIEEREYESVNLAAYKSVPCLTWNTAQSEGYYHLSMYSRYGMNAESQRLPMGIPVVLSIDYTTDVEPKCAQVYKTQFYISSSNLPAPNNTNIKLETRPKLRVYAMSSSNILRDPTDMMVALRVKLNARGLCYEAKHYCIAFHSSPKSLLNRKTEVWVPVLDC